jgi:AcrR family transcriptional regulator
MSAVPESEESPRRQRNKRGEGTKLHQMILDAARAILEESGAESAITIRAVTRRAGIAPQSFYLQFPSLGSLLFEMYGTAFRSLHQALVSAAPDSATPTARLAAVSRAYIDFALENPGRYRALMSSQGALHDDWDPAELPGAETFAFLHEAVGAAGDARSSGADEVHVRTTLLWTQLHGIAILMMDRPTFPWPSIDTLLTADRNRRS